MSAQILPTPTPVPNIDTLVEKDELSPYMGVLIDVQRYRDFVSDERSLKEINLNPGMYVKPKAQETPQIKLFSSSGFLVEFSLALLCLGAGYWIGRGK